MCKKIFIIFAAGAFILNVNRISFAMASKAGHDHHKEEELDPAKLNLSGKIVDGVRVVEITASQYRFDPDPIVVGLGEKVRLVAMSTDVPHGLAIKDFKVNLVIPVKKTTSIEFIADKKGTFHAHCSVFCGPGHSGMHGEFVVK